MTASRNAFPAHLTPLERQRLEYLIGHLAAEPRLARVVVFGSRARGRSRAHSDLDVAVYFSSPRDRRLERWLDDQAETSSGGADGPQLQVVPFFSDEPPNRIDAALRREGIVLWTRN
ncbi:MAG: nucleotidyltransferase domain-containing protein [Betaproteobacteria bacterium]|nr:nucleotidyltransferase domain-containing protein [Betaproteobacteria bacterium]